MFDILVYLFENYVHADACPEADQLARKLSAVGFEEEEIHEALEWLHGLRQVSSQRPEIRPESTSTRLYAESELARIDVDCRGFLAFLENAGLVKAVSRELIIERAMALSDAALTLNRFKVIVLMVLWQQDAPMDSLILDELLTEDDEDGWPLAYH
jgi:Smg protein